MLSDSKIKEFINIIKAELVIKLYTPIRYFQGLNTKSEIKQRILTMIERGKSKKTKPNYTSFETDQNIKTKQSSWTQKFHKKFPDQIKGKVTVEKIAKIAGIPKEILQQVFKRGMSAYLTGHRPGTTQFQWAYARVYSFIMRKDHKNIPHDKDLIEKL
jgi:hypothetical protein